jgi:hypothetical protein
MKIQILILKTSHSIHLNMSEKKEKRKNEVKHDLIRFLISKLFLSSLFKMSLNLIYTNFNTIHKIN